MNGKPAVPGRRRFRSNLFILAALAMTSPCVAERAKGGRSVVDERLVAACIRKASAGRPWLERTLWGLRDQEGGWIGAVVPNSNGTQDLGPLQINSWWVNRVSKVTGRPVSSVRHWLANDTCFNIDTARWIFLTALAVTGDYWKAIGLYHSPIAWRQREYAASVVWNLRRRFGPHIFAVPS